MKDGTVINLKHELPELDSIFSASFHADAD